VSEYAELTVHLVRVSTVRLLPEIFRVPEQNHANLTTSDAGH